MGQCGGLGYTGPTNCDTSIYQTQCYAYNAYASYCEPCCPNGWLCQSIIIIIIF